MHTKMNNTRVDDAQKIDIIMPMYDLIEYSDACLRTSGSLCQYYWDEPALNDNGEIVDFPADKNHSASFKFKQQITGQTGNGGTKVVEKMVPLKCLSRFWRTLEMPLINCKISLYLKWFKNCILVANQNPSFQIHETKLYVSVANLSTQENIELLKRLESGFKRTINWNNYLAETANQA